MRRKGSYYVDRHSCFLLQYHLVLVTKYRHPVLVGDVETEFLEYTRNFFKTHGLNILEVNTCIDHAHILFEAPPSMDLSVFVNSFKAASSRILRRDDPEFLSQYYWKPYFWSLSYFIGTVSESTTDIVAQHIRDQKG